MIQFEVHGEDESGKALVTSKGEPMSISKNYTLSLAEKATLRKDLQAWRGRDFTPDELRGFELKNILGAWAMISVAKSLGNNGKEYTNIANINPVPSNIKKAGLPDGYNQAQMFTITNADMAMYETFSDGLRNKIASSPEWQSRTVMNNDTFQDDPLDGDVPF